MTRNVRLVIGLVFLAIAPLVVIFISTPEPAEPTRGCMSGLGLGMKIVPDFAPVFLAGIPLLIGMAFVISCFFGGDGDATI